VGGGGEAQTYKDIGNLKDERGKKLSLGAVSENDSRMTPKIFSGDRKTTTFPRKHGNRKFEKGKD